MFSISSYLIMQLAGKHKVSAQEILEVVFELSSSQQTVKEERDLNTDVGSTDVPQTSGTYSGKISW